MSDEAIRQYRHLVRREVARVLRRVPANVEADDLEQAGLLGLVDALERYREGRGASFETFATVRIRGAMLDELRRTDFAARSDRAAWRRVGHVRQRLSHQLGRMPTDAELAAALDMTLSAYQALRRRIAASTPSSAAEAPDSDAMPLEQLPPDSAPGPASRFGMQERAAALLEEIERLPPREREVIDIVYRQGLPARVASERLGVTESGVSRIGSRAMERLRIRMATWR